jgi:Lipid A 3-O-deacylase (PagL)
MRFARGLLAAAALSALPLSAFATHIEFEGGRSYMDSYGTKAAFIEATFDEHPIGDSRFTWAPDVSVGWIDGRHIFRYVTSRPGVTDSILLVAAGARLHYGAPDAWYHPFFFSFQVAGQTGRSQGLSSAGEFVSTIGWQWKVVSFQIRHVSNGGITEPNRGETMALVGLGFDI